MPKPRKNSSRADAKKNVAGGRNQRHLFLPKPKKKKNLKPTQKNRDGNRGPFGLLNNPPHLNRNMIPGTFVYKYPIKRSYVSRKSGVLQETGEWGIKNPIRGLEKWRVAKKYRLPFFLKNKKFRRKKYSSKLGTKIPGRKQQQNMRNRIVRRSHYYYYYYYRYVRKKNAKSVWGRHRCGCCYW